MEAQERFWFAIMAALIVGAELATNLDLVKIDQKRLLKYLFFNLDRLRGRTVAAMSLSEPTELLASFMQAYGDRCLIVESFPTPRQKSSNYLASVIGIPRGDRVAYQISNSEKKIRFPINEMSRWLEARGMSAGTVMVKMRRELNAQEIRGRMALGTKWELPPQKLMEVVLDGPAAAAIMINSPGLEDDRPADTPADRPAD